MYREHPSFKTPSDRKITIWRYMDFTEFVSQLDRKALFFSRADQFADAFEGSNSWVNVNRRSQQSGNIAVRLKAYRKCALVNSWHVNEFESAAMWSMHVQGHQGIAIQSTFEHLAASFNRYRKHSVYIGTVSYIDYEREALPVEDVFTPFLHKRKSFEYEQELRAVIVPQKLLRTGHEFSDTGMYVPVSMNRLIKNIFVSPTAPRWFFDVVKSITKKYGLRKNVVQSSLAKDPVY